MDATSEQIAEKETMERLCDRCVEVVNARNLDDLAALEYVARDEGMRLMAEDEQRRVYAMPDGRLVNAWIVPPFGFDEQVDRIED